MTDYEKIPSIDASESNKQKHLHSVDRHKQITDLINKMKEEKKEIIIEQVEKMINEYIKFYGTYIIRIDIGKLYYQKGTKYTFNNGIILEILKEHYEPLGYTLNFGPSNSIDIKINTGRRYCNII